MAADAIAGKPAPTKDHAWRLSPSALRKAMSHSSCSFEAGEQGLFIVIVLVGLMGRASHSLKPVGKGIRQKDPNHL